MIDQVIDYIDTSIEQRPDRLQSIICRVIPVMCIGTSVDPKESLSDFLKNGKELPKIGECLRNLRK